MMLIGVISDTHDNLPMTARACKLFAQRGVETILHAGDFVAPFAVRLLLKAGIPLMAVFGNNDGERAGLLKACPAIHSPPYSFELGGRTIVLAHDAAELNDKVAAGADLVIQGHTHAPQVEAGPPLLLNPGEAAGWLTGVGTCAVVDLTTLRVEMLELGQQETVQL